jgi:hypothetical protein
MPQNHQSGAEGNAFGRSAASKIARALGATMSRKGSNEAMLDGRHIVIKCARRCTQSVGVSRQMLPTLDAVIGAFEKDDGAFDVFSLDADIYRQRMTPTRSRGASAGRVGIVTKRVFTDEGKRIRRLSIDT